MTTVNFAYLFLPKIVADLAPVLARHLDIAGASFEIMFDVCDSMKLGFVPNYPYHRQTINVKEAAMDTVFTQIVSELTVLSAAIMTVMPEDRPVSVVHANWQFPSVSRGDLKASVQTLIDLIQTRGEAVPKDKSAPLITFVEKLIFLRTHTVPNLWGTPQVAIPVFYICINALSDALLEVMPATPAKEEVAATVAAFKRVRERVAALTTELNSVEPKAKNLSEMILRIEQAHSTADQLPTDLADLNRKRDEMSKLLDEAQGDVRDIASAKGYSIETSREMSGSATEAKQILENCEHAYSASTSVGLAAAFSERSSALSWSMRGWVLGLFVALVIGGYVASLKFNELARLISAPDVTNAGIVVSLLLSISSVGGAIWFAWVATKQIGQRFRLSEDYAFKASISRAFEGLDLTRFHGQFELLH